MAFITYGLQIVSKLAQAAVVVVAVLRSIHAQQSVLVGFAHLNQHAAD